MKTAFKPGEPPKVGSDFRVGQIDWHNPQIPRLVRFVALRGMPPSFGPTGAGNRRVGQNGDCGGILPSRSRRCSSWKNSPPKARKPGSLSLSIADGAPISRRPGFFQAAVCRGLSRSTIRLTSASPRSKAILDEDPRQRSRAKWHKTSKKLPPTATYCHRPG